MGIGDHKMATYSFKCPSCSQQFDKTMKMDDSSTPNCPYCNEGNLKKIFYSPGLSFKGKGFYSTDKGK